MSSVSPPQETKALSPWPYVYEGGEERVLRRRVVTSSAPGPPPPQLTSPSSEPSHMSSSARAKTSVPTRLPRFCRPACVSPYPFPFPSAPGMKKAAARRTAAFLPGLYSMPAGASMLSMASNSERSRLTETELFSSPAPSDSNTPCTKPPTIWLMSNS